MPTSPSSSAQQVLADQLREIREDAGLTGRALAARAGWRPERYRGWLIGGELIAAGWDAFTGLVLGRAAWTPGKSLIIDGLRHVDAVIHLKRTVVPTPTIVVDLEIPVGLGAARANRRDGIEAAVPSAHPRTPSSRTCRVSGA